MATLQEIGANLERHFAEHNITAKCNRAYITPQEECYEFTVSSWQSQAAFNRFVKELCFLAGFTYQKDRLRSGGFTLARTLKNRQFISCGDTQDTIKEAVSNTENGLQKCFLCFGKGADGYITTNFDEAVHILIAGSAGSGKSCLLNSLIMQSLCFSNAQLILIDPKNGAEFGLYEQDIHNRIEHVAKTAQDAVIWLKIAVDVMEKRYTEMSRKGLKKYDGERLIIVIDELADLMMMSKAEVEEYIIRIAQKGRAAGVHLIVATKVIHKKILTDNLFYVLSTKICLKTDNQAQSKLIIDCGKGAELLDKGDGLIKLPSSPDLMRCQCPYITDNEIIRCLTH